MGDDRLEYPYDASSPAASLLDPKLLFNSNISDARRGARFMSCDLIFFFENPMSRPEHTRIQSKYSPPDIRDQYNIKGLISENGYVYIKISKGMYRLKHTDIIAYNHLISNMEPHGYYPVTLTTGLWSHKTRKKQSDYVWMTLK